VIDVLGEALERPHADSEDAKLMQAAADCLQRLGKPAIPRLTRAVLRAREFNARVALQSLGGILDNPSLELSDDERAKLTRTFIPLLSKAPGSIANLLVSLGDERAIQPLFKEYVQTGIMKDNYYYYRWLHPRAHASDLYRDAMAKIDPDAYETLTASLHSSDLALVLDAVEKLGTLNNSRARTGLSLTLKNAKLVRADLEKAITDARSAREIAANPKKYAEMRLDEPSSSVKAQLRRAGVPYYRVTIKPTGETITVQETSKEFLQAKQETLSEIVAACEEAMGAIGAN
jgi:hypothetical protein